jgi:CRP-like cAMP-binding protein
MRRPFLILEEGILKRSLFRIDGSMTIGRSPLNPIHINDPGVSRVHARISDDGINCIIEDLRSTNGTFVDGKKISRVRLKNGSKIRLGNSTLRYIEDEESPNISSLLETQEINDISRGAQYRNFEIRPRSKRLENAINKIPIFRGIKEEERKELVFLANLHIYRKGEIIIKEGDPGRTLYLVLDGQVKVFTHDYEGNRIFLSTYGPDEFFGEIGLLTGAPRTASVMATEESLLAELPFSRMKELLERYPDIRKVFEEYLERHLKDTQEKREMAGAKNRRLEPRMNAELPVKFTVLSNTGETRPSGEIFRALSTNISLTGIRLKVEGERIENFPVEGELRMEIKLSGLPHRISATGRIKNRTYDENTGDIMLGIQFVKVSRAGITRLREFIYG